MCCHQTADGIAVELGQGLVARRAQPFLWRDRRCVDGGAGHRACRWISGLACDWRPRTRLRAAADVEREMYDLGGRPANYEYSPLQRRFRDAHTTTSHFQVNPATRELTGRLRLDQPTTPR